MANPTVSQLRPWTVDDSEDVSRQDIIYYIIDYIIESTSKFRINENSSYKCKEVLSTFEDFRKQTDSLVQSIYDKGSKALV